MNTKFIQICFQPLRPIRTLHSTLVDKMFTGIYIADQLAFPTSNLTSNLDGSYMDQAYLKSLCTY